MWPALELILRAIFCFPKPFANDEDDDDEKKERDLISSSETRVYKTLKRVGRVCAFAEFINFIFDAVVVVRLARDGQGSSAAALSGGMLLAWVVSYLGEMRLCGPNRGVFWAPMFRQPSEYYANMTRSERPMRAIYCLVFTEMAAFFFEDAIFVSSFLEQGSLIKRPDSFEQFNLVWTFARAIIAGSIMVLTMVATINIRCFSCCSKADKGEESRTSHFYFGCWEVLKGLVFFAIWACLAAFWIVTMSDINFIFAENIIEDATSKIPVPLWGDIIIYWAGGAYFASPLIFGQRQNGTEPPHSLHSKDTQESIEVVNLENNDDVEIRTARTEV